MTVGQMERDMSNFELVEWQALDSIRAEERKTAERQSKKGMRKR